MKMEEIMGDKKQQTVMARVNKRKAVLQTQLQSLAKGFTNAMFLFGPGGLGKTHVVCEELDSVCGKSWVHHTAYSTPKALMLELAEKPEVIHVFEDCEKLYKTDVAASILRAACGNPKGRDRWITYETANEKIRVNFRGGVLIVSNENIARSKGPLAAVASRFRPIKWDLTLEERMALILEVARQPWNKGDWRLTPSQCKVVAKFLIEEMTGGATGTPVDLRLYTEHALPAYAMWLLNKNETSWQEVVRSKLSGEIGNQGGETRQVRNSRLETIAVQISLLKNTTKEKVDFWKEKTGLGQAIYYRHLKAAKSK
jgi:hypothetical protein